MQTQWRWDQFFKREQSSSRPLRIFTGLFGGLLLALGAASFVSLIAN
jgi:hypothetical protein